MTTRWHLLSLALLLATLVIVVGCGDDSEEGTPGTDTTDTAVDTVGQEIATQDTVTPDDTAAPDLVAEDVADDTAAEVADDVTDDASAFVSERLAKVFLSNPVADEYQLTEVTVGNLTAEDGSLSGAYVNVDNCLNEEAELIQYDIGFVMDAYLCKRTKTVFPGDDGTYLAVEPPEEYGDPDDSYAELSMYYHVNRIHDYFASVHGYTHMDFPLYAIANLQISIGINAWMPFPNAAFMPEGTLESMGIYVDWDQDAIIFGQDTEVDFSYDGDVIYHEYAHATVGDTRLSAILTDLYGLDNAPYTMNEAFADFFSACLTDDPVMGDYALGTLQPGYDLTRRLDIPKSCPGDLFSEVHEDSLVLSTALWELRETLGAEVAEPFIGQALVGFTNQTTFTTAAEGIVQAAKAQDPALEETVTAILDDHGLFDCERVKDVDTIYMGSPVAPFQVEGTMSTGVPAFSSYAPSYLQLRIEVAEGVTQVDVDFTASAGLMGMLVPGPVSFDVAFSKDQPVTYSYGPLEQWATARVEAYQPDPTATDDYRASLKGACLEPGTWYVQLLNEGMATMSITGITVTRHTTDTEAPVTCE